MIIDHLLSFADEAGARQALPLFYRDGAWDTSRCIVGVSRITKEAKMSAPDKDGKVSVVAPEEKAAGFWILIALPAEDPELKKLAGALTVQRGAVKMLNGARIAPIFAGSQYTFDDVKAP